MINEELPLDTVDMSDLLMQFKVMKALGYKSLFDAGFRREMRNPFRRLLYYRLVLIEDTMDKRFFIKSLGNATDRIGFFSDPELFNKVKDAERQEEMKSSTVSDKIISEHETKYREAENKYIPPDEKMLETYSKL